VPEWVEPIITPGNEEGAKLVGRPVLERGLDLGALLWGAPEASPQSVGRVSSQLFVGDCVREQAMQHGTDASY
jgi:hypothetical protein